MILMHLCVELLNLELLPVSTETQVRSHDIKAPKTRLVLNPRH